MSAAVLPRECRQVAIDVGHYRSAAYQAAILRLARFARDDTAPILLQGESGTGKTSMARSVHAVSARGGSPFHHVVLSTLDGSLASSELFGHVVLAPRRCAALIVHTMRVLDEHATRRSGYRQLE